VDSPSGEAAALTAACSALIAAVLLLLPSAPARALDGSPLSYVPLDHWAYRVFDRLAAFGLIPLRAISARPITRDEARRLAEEARRALPLAPPAVARLVWDDLEDLRREFAAGPVFEARLDGFTVNYPVGGFLISGRLAADSPAGVPRSELYASFRLGSVQVQLGRAALAWGPSLRSGLLLSDSAGPMPLVRATAEVPRARLTKVVASLDRTSGSPPGGVVLFGTRLDWAVTPRFRLGLSESIITLWGAPLTFYHLLEPLPVFSAAVASYDLHDALGQVRNTAAGVDFDWLARPGLRLYGEVLVDDAPGIAWPAKVGALAGVFLLDPFRTGRTDLRVEYSFVTNGTYGYGLGLEYAYRGRSLGHWLGPDGDDLYLELTHRLRPGSTLQITYASTRHGEGRLGQPPPGPGDWLLSGVVEHRRTLGLSVRQTPSPSLETRYRLEYAVIVNRDNVAGAQGVETRVGVDLTYRWPARGEPASVAAAAAPVPPAPQPAPQRAAPSAPPFAPPGSSVVSSPGPGRVTLQTWAPVVSSRGALAGASSSVSAVGAVYRRQIGSPTLWLGYDALAPGGQAFWSADLRYPVAAFEHGSVGLIAGWGGLRVRAELGGAIREVASSGPRVGGEFTYRVALDGRVTPLYLRGEIASGIWSTQEAGGWRPFYLWTYGVGAGWILPSGASVEAGYRGAAAVWRVGTAEQTTIRWDGLYVGLAFR